MSDDYSLLDADGRPWSPCSPMVAQKLRVIQSNEMVFPSAVGDVCWSVLKSFTTKEKNNVLILRKTLFILKSRDGL